VVDHEVLKRALAVALEKGGDFADIFVEDAHYNLIKFDDHKLGTEMAVEKGVGVRVVMDGLTYYAITDSFEEKDITAAAGHVRDAVGGAASNGHIPSLKAVPRHWGAPFNDDPVIDGIDHKAEIVRIADETAWLTEHAVQATTHFSDHRRHIILASTLNDRIIEHTLGLTEFNVMVIVEKNGVREYGRHGRSFYNDAGVLTGQYAPGEFARKAGRKATIALTAKDCPRGEMPVVFAAGDNGILFHESCGHGMEADLVEKGSTFGGQMGKQVASPLVTLVDDGTIPGFPGSFEFDDEGNDSQKTIMIENGILTSYLHSSVTARRFHEPMTGSARRETFKSPPIPRMRNTFILSGESDPDDIIRGTKKGLLAVDTGGGGQVNVVTGEFITSIKLGYLIEDGKITYPVKGASIIGRGIDALKDIDMVGNDLDISPLNGRCGKGQQVPVGVGMPTVRVKALTVGGTGDAMTGGHS